MTARVLVLFLLIFAGCSAETDAKFQKKWEQIKDRKTPVGIAITILGKPNGKGESWVTLDSQGKKWVYRFTKGPMKINGYDMWVVQHKMRQLAKE
ncbi:MAG: hypothetical protein VX438_13225 [Planctomycetota bacterium]|nr:hypothetical protein [Planctomycetota bacterium]